MFFDIRSICEFQTAQIPNTDFDVFTGIMEIANYHKNKAKLFGTCCVLHATTMQLYRKMHCKLRTRPSNHRFRTRSIRAIRLTFVQLTNTWKPNLTASLSESVSSTCCNLTTLTRVSCRSLTYTFFFHDNHRTMRLTIHSKTDTYCIYIFFRTRYSVPLPSHFPRRSEALGKCRTSP